jgi:AraC-like DNA-binding protein
MARALNHALRIQARPEARLTLLAMEAGYSDHSGLTRQLIRMFGVTPVGIRGTLGWEWLADRWLIRARDSSGNPYPLQSLS